MPAGMQVQFNLINDDDTGCFQNRIAELRIQNSHPVRNICYHIQHRPVSITHLRHRMKLMFTIPINVFNNNRPIPLAIFHLNALRFIMVDQIRKAAFQRPLDCTHLRNRSFLTDKESHVAEPLHKLLVRGLLCDAVLIAFKAGLQLLFFLLLRLLLRPQATRTIVSNEWQYRLRRRKCCFFLKFRCNFFQIRCSTIGSVGFWSTQRARPCTSTTVYNTLTGHFNRINFALLVNFIGFIRHMANVFRFNAAWRSIVNSKEESAGGGQCTHKQRTFSASVVADHNIHFRIQRNLGIFKVPEILQGQIVNTHSCFLPKSRFHAN